MEEQLNILRASNNELLSDLFLDQGTKREITPIESLHICEFNIMSS